jgi:hypothetical protein
LLPPEFRKEFNLWLIEFFGYDEPKVRLGDSIIDHEKKIIYVRAEDYEKHFDFKKMPIGF